VREAPPKTREQTTTRVPSSPTAYLIAERVEKRPAIVEDGKHDALRGVLEVDVGKVLDQTHEAGGKPGPLSRKRPIVRRPTAANKSSKNTALYPTIAKVFCGLCM
jgi:hypothetical protein